MVEIAGRTQSRSRDARSEQGFAAARTTTGPSQQIVRWFLHLCLPTRGKLQQENGLTTDSTVCKLTVKNFFATSEFSTDMLAKRTSSSLGYAKFVDR